MTTFSKEQIEQTVQEIIALYENYGGLDYIGEPVSQLEHMFQAAMLAESEGYTDEIVLAAFFHDIGHLCEHLIPVQQMDGFGVMDHEKLGAEYLRKKGFSNKICKLVASHVAAKRYLTFKYKDYFLNLSLASKQTLTFQGGKMNEMEASEFEKDPDFEMIIALRRWDEQAKLINMILPSIQFYKRKMLAHLIEQHKIN
jgi:phosphonate degradation associated HDIG domain protein